MQLTKQTITELIAGQQPNIAGSLYIPTNPHSSSPAVSADKTRFKNALQEIRRHKSYDEAALGATMKKLDAMYEDVEFWKHQTDGLAVLFSDSTLEYFKLPYEPTQATYLTDHFVISPLLVMEALNNEFYVLDVNTSDPRLYHGNHGSLEQVNQDNMPGTLDDEVGKLEYGKQLQHQHGGQAMYHGHNEDDVINDENTRYLQKIADAVDKYLVDENAPLLVAGTPNRAGNVKKVLGYKHTFEDGRVGSIEKMSPDELYKTVLPFVTSHFTKLQADAVQRLSEAPPEHVAIGSKEILDITTLETTGRIESLFLPIYRQTRDNISASENRTLVVELPEDIDGIENLAIAVVQQGGTIVPVEIDGYEFLDKPKALCRY